MLNPHNWMTALDPPGRSDRRWQCNYCGDTGTMEEVRSRPCAHVYPPCAYCGQTPECALDCPGIAKALSGDDVHVAGMVTPDMPKA
jgi:hypothetical protein